MTTHESFPAVDMKAASGKGMFNRRVTIIRCVRVGQTVYAVSAQGPNMEPQTCGGCGGTSPRSS